MIREKLNWYLTSLENLGLRSLLQLQLQKTFGSRRHLIKFTSKILQYPVYARPRTSDVSVFGQIFVEREYRCLDHIKKPGLILDCGANVGYSSAYFLSRFPTCSVVAVEPVAGNFDLLKTNIAPYGSRCTAVQAAVWPFKDILQFKSQLSNSGQEWAQAVERAPSNDTSTSIDTISIPELIKLTRFERVSILKIDIEGAERELFLSGSSE